MSGSHASTSTIDIGLLPGCRTSTSSINFESLSSHKLGKRVIVYGNVKTSATCSLPIIHEPIEKKDSIIIGNSANYEQFKTLTSCAHLATSLTNISFFDTQNNRICHLSNTRTSNRIGTVRIESPEICYLSDAIIPNCRDEAIYFPITNYSAISGMVHPAFIAGTIGEDLSRLMELYDISNVVFVIGEELDAKIGESFRRISANYIVVKNGYEMKYIIECLFGKIIKSTPASFDGMLQFGKQFTILHATTYQSQHKIESENLVTFIPRSDGRVKVITSCEKGSSLFAIILEENESIDAICYSKIIFSEERTGKIFELSLESKEESVASTPASLESLVDHSVDKTCFLPDAYLDAYLENCNFLFLLNIAVQTQDKTFLHTHAATIVQKLFGHVVGQITSASMSSEEQHNEYAKMCITDYQHIEYDIVALLTQQQRNKGRPHGSVAPGRHAEYTSSSPQLPQFFGRQVTQLM
jgi:hypothetical protein